MSPVQSHCVFWPPAKTSFLASLPGPSAHTMFKDIDKGRVIGMSYRIDGERVYAREKPRLLYFIQIDGWDYSIKNDSNEYPILSFSYLDLGLQHGPLEKDVQNIRVLGRSMRRGHRLPEKTLRVASYLMQQIAADKVVDANRVLTLYKMQPPHPLMPGFFQNSFFHAGTRARGGE